MSTSLELSYLMRLVLEAAAFGAVAVFGTAFRRRGPRAVLAAVGGCLGIVVALVSLEIYVERRYLDVTYVSDFLVRHGELASEILAWAHVVALLLIAAAFVPARAAGPRAPGEVRSPMVT